MHEAEKLSLEQIQAFLNASEAMRFEGETQVQICRWVEAVLARQEYHQQNRRARGVLRTCNPSATKIAPYRDCAWDHADSEIAVIVEESPTIQELPVGLISCETRFWAHPLDPELSFVDWWMPRP